MAPPVIQAAVRCEKMPEVCGYGEMDEQGKFAGVMGDDGAYEDNNEGITEGFYKHPLMTIESEELGKKEYVARKLGGKTEPVMTATEALDVVSKHVTVNKAQLFPTRRRPVKREMSTASQAECDNWVKELGVSIYEGLMQEEKDVANRLHQEKNHVASETYSGLSRLSRLERNLWDIVVKVHCVMLTDTVYSHGCSLTLWTQFCLPDAV